MAKHKLKERTYLDADGKIAKKGKEAVLLGAEGAEIPEEQADELGLTKAKKPAANKQRKAPEGKGK